MAVIGSVLVWGMVLFVPSFYAALVCKGLTGLARRVVRAFHTARNRVLKIHDRQHAACRGEIKSNPRNSVAITARQWVCLECYRSVCVTYVFILMLYFFFMLSAFSPLSSVVFTSSKNDTFCHAVDISAGSLWLPSWLLLQCQRSGFPLGAGEVTCVRTRLHLLLTFLLLSRCFLFSLH